MGLDNWNIFKKKSIDNAARAAAVAASLVGGMATGETKAVELERPAITNVQQERVPVQEVKIQRPPITEVTLERPPLVSVTLERPPLKSITLERPSIKELERPQQ